MSSTASQSIADLPNPELLIPARHLRARLCHRVIAISQSHYLLPPSSDGLGIQRLFDAAYVEVTSPS
jgi:hypothetical protein